MGNHSLADTHAMLPCERPRNHYGDHMVTIRWDRTSDEQRLAERLIGTPYENVAG